MIFYHIGALIKIFVGVSIAYLLFNYINIYQDPIIGLGFGFFAVFLIVWGGSFYLFFLGQKLFAVKGALSIASRSYKLSLLFGLFVLVNLSLISLEERNKILGGIIFLIFLILHIITGYENEQ
ncbi:hypothetical protein [Candidatus Absconditicoccus praedator]|uniref:hypothetical protein n=1 Tax=Candidatus Absconditicoccus praedator TaxID=2735562 RepID=UPI001E2A8AE1|nr:hypothetical protein [Candidatus Absconditicoccus praedator]UFX83363.1 hypothetical protein HLG78_04510 [Candidatus Absconditicoccus praedator]